MLSEPSSCQDHAEGVRLALQHVYKARRDAVFAAGEHNIEVML
jgi:hypothetical protein